MCYRQITQPIVYVQAIQLLTPCFRANWLYLYPYRDMIKTLSVQPRLLAGAFPHMNRKWAVLFIIVESKLEIYQYWKI